MSDLKIGIDLGTTYSCIAVIDPATGLPTVVKNFEEEETTPSVVLYDTDNGEIIVGKDAKANAAIYPKTCFDSIKRHMGEAGFRIYVGDDEYYPQDLSAEILKKLVRDFKQFYPEYDMDGVTITCPAYFDENQKKATRQAGEIAGFKNINIVEEPIAAAISYGAKTDKNQTVFVFDLGGGTFDITIIKIENGNYSVFCTGGDSALGGKDWDKELEEHIIEKIVEAEPSLDEGEIKSGENYPGIVAKVEDIKKQLSTRTSVKNYFTVGASNVAVEVTREEFESWTEALLDKTRGYIDALMSEKNLSFDDIDKFLLVGGSTKMPQVPAMLNKYYPQLAGKIESHDPNLAVAKGAALYQQMVTDVRGGGIRKFTRVMPHTYGIIAFDDASQKDMVCNIVFRNEQLPLEGSREFSPSYNGQEQARIQVCKNDALAEDGDQEVDLCPKIGEFVFDLAKDSKMNEEITVKIRGNEKAELEAECTFRGISKVYSLQFTGDQIMSEDEINRKRLGA